MIRNEKTRAAIAELRKNGYVVKPICILFGDEPRHLEPYIRFNVLRRGRIVAARQGCRQLARMAF